MKKLLFAALVVSVFAGMAQSQVSGWQVAGDRITTKWSSDVNPLNPLPEYPRPQMVRNDWKNLNGLWEYAITASGAAKPSAFDGKILVPFAIESALSGVGKNVGPDNILWYRTRFTIPSNFRKKNILLHFVLLTGNRRCT